MADSTTDYNKLDPLGDEAAVVDEVDAAVSGARKKPRAVDMVPEEPDAMAPDEEYQLTPAGRRERIGQIVRLVKKYRVWDNLTPVRLRRLLEELGPMFVKMGQILANRSEILPQRFCDELRRLRSDVEPVPYEVVLRCLEEEYGLRIFERSSTGMIPTEQGRRFIEQAARVLEEVDRLTEDAHHARERCAELRVMIPHATYASYAAVDFLKEAAGADQLRIHIREGGSMEALDFVLRRGYHLALLRYAAEDDDHYIHYCARRGLKMEPVMEFEYRLLTNRDGPLAKHEVKDLSELNHYMEIMHDDFQLPGEDGGDGVRWHVNDSRRIHVYERCSQLSILQQLPSAYMWASPMPQRALDQFHLVLKKCPAQRQVMRDVLVYPDHGALRSEEQAFIDLLHREAALTVK